MSLRRAGGIVCILGLLLSAAAPAANADEGMWLPNRLPTKLLKERYGFEPKPEWVEHVQKSCVRFGSGGSGSIVSSDGLVMTNHHVGSDDLEKLSTPERNLLKTGFHARTRAEELPCKDLELNVLWSIEDVTPQVDSVTKAAADPAAANVARIKKIAEIEKAAQDKTGLKAEVVTLFQGARYHLYCYKRYTDVRMVFAPEQQIAFFGGDNDNFEYPRYDLDCCFVRIYENGQPLKAEHHLSWSQQGAKDGDLVFITGHPGRTQRMYTVAHLKMLRDHVYNCFMRMMWRREVELQTFAGRSAEQARIASGDIFGVQNSRKAFTGIMAGLQDPRLIQQKADAEREFQARFSASSDNLSQWAGGWELVAKAQENYRQFLNEHFLLSGRGRVRSELFARAIALVQLAEEKPKPNGDRLREYRDSNLETLYLDLFSPAPIYDALEIDRMRSWFALMCETFGGDDPRVMKLLAGKSPRDRAEELIRGTRLKDVAERKRLSEGGTAAIASSNDPLIRLAREMDADSRAIRKRYEDQVEALEREGYARIAGAKFALEGEDTYPDATFTLRFAFGTVKGYEEDGMQVPPFTNFAGLYERARERAGQAAFELPSRWTERKDKLNLQTPFNFVCTNDIIGGNSGSPVIDREGRVVGLVFDGNIQGLIWDLIYTDKQARAVAVDSRAVIEALRQVYDAKELADELTRG